jgi:hypothetical protein
MFSLLAVYFLLFAVSWREAYVAIVSGLAGLAEGDALDGGDLSLDAGFSTRGNLRVDQPDQACRGFGAQ